MVRKMKSLSNFVVKNLIKKNIKIAFAESCTGGLLSATITSNPGSSKVLDCGLVVYSNKSKNKLLKISPKKIKKYGAVSEQICLEMLKSISKISKSNISISITGIAGPNGGTKEKPVGLVYVGIKRGNKTIIKKYLFKNQSRSYIQKNTVNKCLRLILSLLK